MASRKRLLSELTPDISFPYTVKVRVIEKSRTLTSAAQTRYQNLTLKDEQGHAMRATLYNQDIDAYDAAIEEGRDYEISNARVKKIQNKYRNRYQNIDNEHEITFTRQTILQKLATTNQTPPVYSKISEIPRVANPEERFDLLAVVIFVEDRRKIIGFDGTNKDVREIVTLDDSTNQMITISAWNDLAREKTEDLQNLVSSFPIVGFKKLKISHYKGFTLSTTPSTNFIMEPEGERIDELRKWRELNLDLLIRRQIQVTKARKPTEETDNLSILNLLQQQVDETIQEEQHWLRVFIPNFRGNQIIMYLGCNHCSANIRYEEMFLDECPSCAEHDSLSIRRLMFNFKATDGTGTIQLVAYQKVAEIILRHTADELYQMNNEDRNRCYEYLSKIMRTSPTYILLTPSILLSTNRVLQWVIKSAKSDLSETS